VSEELEAFGAVKKMLHASSVSLDVKELYERDLPTVA